MEDHLGQLVLWPRQAVKRQSGEWRLGPDTSYELADGTEHTPPDTFPLKLKCRTRLAIPILGGSTSLSADRHECIDSGSPALFVLQQCPEGLPGEVIAEAVRLAPDSLKASLG